MVLNYLNKLTKIILGIIAVLVIAVVAGININFNSQKSDLSVVALANIEALAQNENGGTDVGVCVMRVGPNGTYGQMRFCDYRTNATTIFPCLENDNDFYDSAKKDRCTN